MGIGGQYIIIEYSVMLAIDSMAPDHSIGKFHTSKIDNIGIVELVAANTVLTG
jgi:hypothetical protein